MARPYRMREIAREQGEPLVTLVPRVLNETGTIRAAALRLGVSPRNLYRWCKRNRVEKVTRQRIGDTGSSVVMYVVREVRESAGA